MPSTGFARHYALRTSSWTEGRAFQIIRSRAWMLLAGTVVAVTCFSVLSLNLGLVGSVAIALVLSLFVAMVAGAALVSVLPVAALLRDVWRDTAGHEAGHEAIVRW